MTNNQNMRDIKLIRSAFNKILFPALIAGASSNLSSMIDGIIVGNCIGKNALAAVNASRPANQIFAFVSVILALGLANCIARAIGENDKEKADSLFTTGILSAIFTAAILVVLQLIFLPGICKLFANNDTLYPLVTEYYGITFFSAFFVLINELLSSAMRTDGLPKLAGLVMLLPHVLNALLDLVFINVFDMGLAGAALATVLGYVLGSMLCLYYLIFKRTYHFRFGGYFSNLSSMTLVGLPPALNIGLIAIKILLINRLALSYGGADAMAIISIIMVAWALESLFISGIMQTTIPLISLYYGNSDYHGVRAVFKYAFRILMSAEAVLLIFFELFPKLLCILFGMREPTLLAAASVAIRVFAIQIPMEAFIMLTVTYYSSTGNKKSAVLLSVFQGLIATLIVIYPLAHFFGINGVWISYPAANLIPLLIIAIISRGSLEKYFRMKGHTYLKEFSIDYSRLSEIVKSVIDTVAASGIDHTIANRTGMAVEEMAVSAFERNKSDKLHVDVTVRKTDDDTILVSFSDDGIEFDPVAAAAKDENTLSNIAVLNAVSKKIEYGRVVGINKTDIELQ